MRSSEYGLKYTETGRLGLDLDGVRQPPIDPEAQGDGRGIFRTLPRQADLEIVVGVEVEPVCRLDVARIDPAEVLEAQAVLDFDRFRQRQGDDRPVGNPAGGGQVFLHQHWRDGQDIADVVEAVARIVGRKVLVGAKLDGEEIADRVRVLRPVQTPRGDPPRIGLHRRIRPRELLLEERDQRRDLLVGPKHILGRHLLRLELRQNRIPPIAIGGERFHRRKEGDVEPPGEVGGVVTLAAGLFEQRLGGRAERRSARWVTRLRRRLRRGRLPWRRPPACWPPVADPAAPKAEPARTI